MAKSAIAALLLCCIAAIAAAQDEPQERMKFKGLALGATIAQLQAAFKVSCAPDKSAEFDTVCIPARSADKTFATVPARSLRFGLFDGRLDSVQMTFELKAYEQLKASLDNLYGEATPSGGLAGLCTYMQNGDRTFLIFEATSRAAVVLIEAAAGKEERAKRRETARANVRKDM